MRVSVVVWMIVFTLTVTACLPVESPDNGAKEWLESMVRMEGAKIAERTCSAHREEIQNAGLWMSAIGILGQGFLGVQTKPDMSGVRYSVFSRSGNTACVNVSGEMNVSVMAFFQTQQVNETIRMVFEGGKWKYCGECS